MQAVLRALASTCSLSSDLPLMDGRCISRCGGCWAVLRERASSSQVSGSNGPSFPHARTGAVLSCSCAVVCLQATYRAPRQAEEQPPGMTDVGTVVGATVGAARQAQDEGLVLPSSRNAMCRLLLPTALLHYITHPAPHTMSFRKQPHRRASLGAVQFGYIHSRHDRKKSPRRCLQSLMRTEAALR